MPSKKNKYNARFPAGRIKKIMRTDDEVGKVAQAVPIIISRTLELFVHSLLTKTMEFTSAKRAKTLSPSHMKQCILSESRFDFLKDLVKNLPDVSGQDEEIQSPPLTPSVAVNIASTTEHLPPVQHSEPRINKQAGIPIDVDRRIDVDTSKEQKGESLGIDVNDIKIEPIKQVAEFQITVPPTFNISQPNFYTEVNPMTMSSNSNINTANQVTCNYAQSTNIDEDYDT
ncbi:uncharacterized protein NC2alpha [Prorops nasuta]|uniref:uncharacterized protein NC2alpha n=1 Tax=Prorops nasuta TaxID=863751 RepID=UPI0034CF03CC